jgi:hypothetical protein
MRNRLHVTGAVGGLPTWSRPPCSLPSSHARSHLGETLTQPQPWAPLVPPKAHVRVAVEAATAIQGLHGDRHLQNDVGDMIQPASHATEVRDVFLEAKEDRLSSLEHHCACLDSSPSSHHYSSLYSNSVAWLTLFQGA